MKARLPDYQVTQEQLIPPRTAATPPVVELRGDDFWLQDVKVLWKKDRLLELVPDATMTWEEKLNAVIRFALLATILIFVQAGKPGYLIYGAVTVALLSALYYQDDTSSTRWYRDFRTNNVGPVRRVPCQMATPTNPFANILPTDALDRPQPCPQSDPEQARLTRRLFDHGFPRDIDPASQEAFFNQFEARYNEGPNRDLTSFEEFLAL